jgi:hypothetical protein
MAGLRRVPGRIDRRADVNVDLAAAPSGRGRRIRVGVVGANPDRGWGTSAHLPALACLPEFEIAAVATSSRATRPPPATRCETSRGG